MASNRARVLSVLHAIVALNAIGGGIFGLAGAPGVPVAWLQHTPFDSYLIPSLILIVVIGGAHTVASDRMGRNMPGAPAVSLVAGAILMGWIGVQITLIGYVSWLQPAVALAALANLALAWGLHRTSRGVV